MQVHVGINAKDRKGFLKQLDSADKFLPPKTWLHVDISDSSFSSFKSYVNIGDLKKHAPRFNFEAHLMIPEKKIYSCIKSPFKKIWVHASVIKNWERLIKASGKNKISFGAVIGLNDRDVIPNIPHSVGSLMVLAVPPGPSGQKFNKKALKLIYFLRKKLPRATIIVDGGVNGKVARDVKRAGATGVLSTSYIWNSNNPLITYKELKSI